MPLNEDVKRNIANKLEEYEGRTNHMYLDTRGYVTIGVGHMIKDRDAVAAIVLCITKNGVPAQIAALKEKQDEYDTVAKQPLNYPAFWYKQHTQLIMKDEDIQDLFDKHIESFYTELVGIYQKSKGYFDDFDKLPQNVQSALFDMIFNLGAVRIVKTFSGFDKAIKAGDWAKAAQESKRNGISKDRNEYVKKLLSTAK